MGSLKHDHTPYDTNLQSKDQGNETEKTEAIAKHQRDLEKILSTIPDPNAWKKDTSIRKSEQEVKPKSSRKPIKSKKRISIISSGGKEITLDDIPNKKGGEYSNQFVSESKKNVSGIFAIFLGFFGIHKFILGYTKQGLVMLLVTLFTFGMAAPFVGLIGFIEGIIYLTKSDDEFNRIYQVGKKSWF